MGISGTRKRRIAFKEKIRQREGRTRERGEKDGRACPGHSD